MSVVNILDIDIYKFIMHQFIFERYRDTRVTFALTNRSKTIRIADEIPIEVLREELDRIRKFKFDDNFIAILDAAKPGFFTKEYLHYLRYYFELSDYELSKYDGQYQVAFRGSWLRTTLWETPLLSTLSELRSVYTGAMSPLCIEKAATEFGKKAVIIEQYNELYNRKVQLSEFGTRRRHSQQFQESMLKHSNVFTSTSNVWLSHIYKLPCTGTYAHEIPMVLTSLAHAAGGWNVTNAQFEFPSYCVERFGETFILPDTYGSTQFYERFPFLSSERNHIPIWKVTDVRIDSKHPLIGGEEALTFFKDYISEETKKGLMFSDGLNSPAIIYLDHYFKDLAIPKFGWGTDATNGTFGTASLVCKAITANEEPCIKLSDKYAKSTDSVFTSHYYDIFGTKGMQ